MARQATPATAPDLPYIAPDLRALARPIETLVRWPGNPRRGDLSMIRSSFLAYGQMKPIVVQESSRRIVAGNHWHEMAESVGYWPCDPGDEDAADRCRAVGLDAPVRVTHVAAVLAPMDDATARRYLLMDNRSADVGTYDDRALVEILESLNLEGLLSGTGYATEDLDELVRRLQADDEGLSPEERLRLWGGMPEFQQDDQGSWRHIVVHFRGPEDLERFLATIGQRLPPGKGALWYPEEPFGRLATKRYAGAAREAGQAADA